MGTDARHQQTDPGVPGRAKAVLARAAALVAVAAVALPVASSGAQSIDDLNARIASAESEAASLGAAIEARTAELADAQYEAIMAAQREAQLSAVLARGEEREAELEGQVASARTELEAAKARLQRGLDVLADRLVAIYRNGTADETLLLLNADGFDDLATRAEFLRRIQDADASLVSRVRSLRDDVADKLEAVERAEAQAAAFNDRIASARAEIAAVRADAEAQAVALAAARERQQAALAGLQSQVSGWTAEVQRLEQISAQQAQQTVGGWVGDWAIPEAIVMCESGGNFDAVNPSSGAGGAYQILPSTWELYGGQGLPQNASPAEQHRIASQVWADSGSGAWVCAG
jgi:septal ring factor EnvC (AmiA/AmiB activator)